MENLKCDLCNSNSNQYNYLSCNHKICPDCFYKLCLFNKNLLQTYTSKVEKLIELQCLLCTPGKLLVNKSTILEKLAEASNSNLQTNFDNCSMHNKEVKTFCGECKTLMCPECFLQHKFIPIFSSHTEEKISNPFSYTIKTGNNTNCIKHKNSIFYYYCTDCKLPICEVCKASDHKSHGKKYIQDFLNEKRDLIFSQLKLPSDSIEQTISKIEDSEEKIKDELKKKVTNLKDKINFIIEYLKENVEVLDETMEGLDEEVGTNMGISKFLYRKLYSDVEIFSNSSDYNPSLSYLNQIPKNQEFPTNNIKISDSFDSTLNGIKNLIDSQKQSSDNQQIISMIKMNQELKIHNLTGHNGRVYSMTKLNDGRIVSCSEDKTIKIWDNFNCTHTLNGHTNKVLCVISLRDGSIASGSDDATIRIWDPKDNFKCINIVNLHSSSICCLTELDDKRIASGSVDTSIKISDPKQKFKCIFTLSGHSKIVRALVQLHSGRLASASWDTTVRIWDNEDSFKCIYVLNGHTDTVRGLINLDDGSLASCSWDRTIRIWNPQEMFKCTHVLNAHTDTIRCLILLEDGRIASGSDDKTIRIWDPKSNYDCTQTFKTEYIIWSMIQSEGGKLVFV